MRHTDTIRLSQTTAAAARHAAASGSTRLTGFHEIHADTVDAASLISGGSPASILSSLRPGARTFGTYIAAKSRFRLRSPRLFSRRSLRTGGLSQSSWQKNTRSRSFHYVFVTKGFGSVFLQLSQSVA